MKKVYSFFLLLIFSYSSLSQVRNLGSSANALSATKSLTNIWADPTIGDGTINGTVIFIRQMMGATSGPINNGRLAYDISIDNGLHFDSSRGPVYLPSLSTVINPSNARYPQGAIYNPIGSNLAADAYMTYSSSTMNGTNACLGYTQYNWGGRAFGVHKLDGSLPATQHEEVSDSINGVWYFTPSHFHMCKNGTTFSLYASRYGNSYNYAGADVAFEYTDNLIIDKGVWNNTLQDYQYSRSLLGIPAGTLYYSFWACYGWVPTWYNKILEDAKIVFDDSGLVGYLVVKEFQNNWQSNDSTSKYYIHKTTNGGATWNLLPLPEFDTMDELCADSGLKMGIAGTSFDIAMDMNSNLHIISCFGSLYRPDWFCKVQPRWSESYGGIFDLFTQNGGITWKAHRLTTRPLSSLEGVMGNPLVSYANSYDLRPQICRSYDGDKLFFCWFETDTVNWVPNAIQQGFNNQNPDMHIVGYDVNTQLWTSENNTTAYPALNGDADGACILGTVSYYALQNDTTGFKIPTVYSVPSALTTYATPDDTLLFSFRYIDNIVIQNTSFTLPAVYPPAATPNEVNLSVMTATINASPTGFAFSIYPNPADNNTTMSIALEKPESVRLEISNTLGQVVYSQKISGTAGNNSLILDCSKFSSGLYLCTVLCDGQRRTQVMAVH